MKYLLILSLVLNVYFQFQRDLFYLYINQVHCDGGEFESVGFTETWLLKIPYLQENNGGINPVTCKK